MFQFYKLQTTQRHTLSGPLRCVFGTDDNLLIERWQRGLNPLGLCALKEFSRAVSGLRQPGNKNRSSRRSFGQIQEPDLKTLAIFLRQETGGLGGDEDPGCPDVVRLDFRSVFANTAIMALTPKQKNVLDFVASFTERSGYCPSFEEIARGVGLGSLATVHKHITALQQKGYLKRRYNESRSLEVSEDYLRSEHNRLEKRENGFAFEMPLMGTIAAGAPVEAMESPETLDFGDFAGATDMFALRVRGDSMIEDHICAGDYVLVQKVQAARDGEIVVALLEGAETTLKRLYREGENIRLQPANASMAPIIVPAANVQLQGRVLAVLRKYH